MFLYSKADFDQLTWSQQKPYMCSHVDFQKVFYYSALAFSSVSHFPIFNSTNKAFLIYLIYLNNHSYREEWRPLIILKIYIFLSSLLFLDLKSMILYHLCYRITSHIFSKHCLVSKESFKSILFNLRSAVVLSRVMFCLCKSIMSIVTGVCLLISLVNFPLYSHHLMFGVVDGIWTLALFIVKISA